MGLCGMVVATIVSVLYRSINRKSISGERRASTPGSQLRRTPLHYRHPRPGFAASVLRNGDSVYDQSTGQTPERHVPEAGSNPECGLPVWLRSSIFAPTATFCFRFAPAATLCFRTKHSAQEPNDEEQGVPEYGAATLLFA
jgi:hypothetical protein